MTRLYYPFLGVVFASGLLILCGFLDERDARIAAEAEARQIEQALRTPCEPIDGQRVIATVGYDGHEFARWCGYYRTVIESVRVTWERAR